jgi:membrane-associated protein
VGYWLGRLIGPRMFRNEKARIFNPRMLERGRAFFDEHGNKSLILARFVPVIRALVPTMVGMSLFNPRRFLMLNIIGGALWVVGLMGLGYGLGYVPVVANNVEWVILAVIILTSLPFPIEVLRGYIKRRRAR